MKIKLKQSAVYEILKNRAYAVNLKFNFEKYKTIMQSIVLK